MSTTNYDDDIAVGKPTLQEILEYFSCEGTKHNDSSSAPSSSNTSGCSLDESFKELLQKKMNNLKNISELDDSVDFRNDNLGGDDTFALMERLCDRSLDQPVPVQLDSNDITQLNEINEPSMLWENTVAKISPVKLCGLLRPSTILEEDSQDISDLSVKSTQTETTVKDKTGTPSISVYTEANQNESSASSTIPSSLENLIDFDIPSIKKKHFYYDDKGNFISPRSSNGMSSNVSEYVTATSNGNSEDNIIELSSSDGSTRSSSTEETKSITNTLDEVSSLNEDVSFDPDSLDIKFETPNKSLDFNDTIEKMDYMMKQGLKLMQEKSNVGTLDLTTTQLDSPMPIKPTHNLSPQLLKKREAIKPGIKSHNSSNSNNGIASSCLVSKNFKKPTMSKVASAKKKGGYDYIVSPIGMYIKSSPVIPLTKTGNSRRDIFESKLAHIRDSTASSTANESFKVTAEKISPCPFPRKAYITAENNHVVDERVNPRIIGGEKVQRLFGGYNRSPTVTKHQGRFKITNSSGKKENKPVDDSFKDLSLVSGDVSFHVIKSAKKY